jgi:uncharacterized protein (TIGR03437 family)
MKLVNLFEQIAIAAALAAAANAQSSSAASSSVTRISATPLGAQFSVDGQNYSAPTAAVWPPGSKHTLDASPSQVSPGAGTQMTFQSWIWPGGSFQDHQLTVTSDPAITSYTAQFNVSYALSVVYFPCGDPAASPGVIVVNGNRITCDTQVYITAGGSAIVQAIPNSGFIFAGWANAANQAVLGFQSTVTMNGPESVYPLFAPARNINLVTSPPGLQVLADTAPITTPYTLQWGMGTTHSLTAISPQLDLQSNPWVFSSWSDGGAMTHAYTVPIVTTPDNVVATYVPGVGATFTSVPGGLNLTVDGVSTLPPYNFIWGVGETHTFSAPAQQTDSTGRVWAFSSWSTGAAALPIAAAQAAQSISVPASAAGLGLRYIATYTPVGHLTVNSSVAGQNVTVNGQACATPCDIKQPVGTKIDIAAPASVPNGANSRLDLMGWTGGASGGPGDLVVTLGSDPITVYANYQQMNYLAMSSNPTQSVNWTVQPASSDGYYNAAATVNISVSPLPGFKFSNWVGDLSGTVSAGAVAMTAPRSVTAMLTKVPYVAPSGVQNAAGAIPAAGVAPGSIVSLFGANLGASTAVAPAGSVPQSLGGVTVIAGQQFMPLFFVSPGQINFQIPGGIELGPQALTVSAQGQPNIQATFQVVRNAPGLFQQTIDGAAFGLVYHADGSAVTQSAPAQIGETITLYGTGFGPTNPPRVEGFALPSSPVYGIVDPVNVTAGSVTAPAVSSYALAGSIGVDAVQFVITDPAVSGTNASVIVTVNGQDSNAILVPVR